MSDDDFPDEPPEPHDSYPWCAPDDRDRMLRSWVFESMVMLEIKDKPRAMAECYEWIRDGTLPAQKLRVVP